MRPLVLSSFAALVLAASPAYAQRTYNLDECVQTALSHNPDAKSSDLEVEGAENVRSGARGEMLPRISVQGSALEFNSAFILPFGPSSFRIRDPFTASFGATLTQPLTGLFVLLDRYKVAGLGIDVAQIKRDATKRDLSYRVAEAYIRLLEAKRLAEVAKASVTQLDAQRRQATSLLTNGVIGKNDLLRAELAFANAQQREINARGQISLLRGQLATLMGIPIDSPVEPAAVQEGDTQMDDGTVEVAETGATTQRVELKELAQRISIEDSHVSAARARYMPNINLVGNYAHVEGSQFEQKNAAYVGVVGTWDVLDWGVRSGTIGEAKTKREQARLAYTKVADDLRLEARKAYIDLDAAKQQLIVAKSAVEQAEENYRIVSKRFEQAVGTSFDVVDAEALLTTARAQIENARYGLLVARLSLQRATGGMTPKVR